MQPVLHFLLLKGCTTGEARKIRQSDRKPVGLPIGFQMEHIRMLSFVPTYKDERSLWSARALGWQGGVIFGEHRGRILRVAFL